MKYNNSIKENVLKISDTDLNIHTHTYCTYIYTYSNTTSMYAFLKS